MTNGKQDFRRAGESVCRISCPGWTQAWHQGRMAADAGALLEKDAALLKAAESLRREFKSSNLSSKLKKENDSLKARLARSDSKLRKALRVSAGLIGCLEQVIRGLDAQAIEAFREDCLITAQNDLVTYVKRSK